MKQNKKKMKFSAAVTLCGVGAMLAALLYGGVRWFLGRQNAGILQEVLWEVIPALALVLFMVVAVNLLYAGVRRTAKTVARKIGERDAARRAGRAYTPAEGGEFAAIEQALVRDDAAVAAYLSERESAAVRTEREKTELENVLRLHAVMAPERLTLSEVTFGLSACTLSAPFAGGDFSDFFRLDHARVCFVVCNVWAAGFPAVLSAARIKELVREYVSASRSLKDSFDELNAILCQEGSFPGAALFVGVFDPVGGDFRYLNAGFPSPMLIGEQRGVLHTKPCDVLGLYSDATFVEEATHLAQGQAIVLHTAGLTGARNRAGKRFGSDRLYEVAKPAWDSSLGADHIADQIRAELLSFTEGCPLSDDISFMVLYYPDGLQKVFRPVIAELETMRDLLYRWLQADPRKNKIYLACEEIFTNIVNHSGASSIQLCCQREGNNLVVRFTDDGEPFNPLPSLSDGSSYNAYGQGGMGMAIIRQLAGEVYYRTREKRNVMTVRFPVFRP